MKYITSLNLTEKGDIDYSPIGIIDLPWAPAFEFEKMDWKPVATFTGRHPYYPIVASAIYLVVIFGIQHFMKDRKVFDLRRELVLWNGALGIFSIFGFIRVLPSFINQLNQPNGFYTSLCALNGASHQESFWMVAFLFSKYVELGDTVFIVLRKRRLQVLQWFHHAITLIMCWTLTPFTEPFVRYVSNMNYGVHSLMYPYFALRALNVRVPQKFANLITTLQLLQMLVGFYVNAYSVYMYYFGASPCYRHPTSMALSAFTYGSFVILFGKLYYDKIVKEGKSRHKKT